MALDPVCGMEVDENSATESTTYLGQAYYFCSTDCKEEFDAAPEDYAGDEGLELTGT